MNNLLYCCCICEEDEEAFEAAKAPKLIKGTLEGDKRKVIVVLQRAALETVKTKNVSCFNHTSCIEQAN